MAEHDQWDGFQAAHIFPLAYAKDFEHGKLDRWILETPKTGGKINSVKNGMLLRSDIHQLFDCYNLSVNPDACAPFSLSKALQLTVILG
jgi:hypothetical protein